LHDDDSAPDARYIFAPELTTELVESRATVVWDDPATPMALWHVPRAP
jgi:hypothetical protein